MGSRKNIETGRMTGGARERRGNFIVAYQAIRHDRKIHSSREIRFIEAAMARGAWIGGIDGRGHIREMSQIPSGMYCIENPMCKTIDIAVLFVTEHNSRGFLRTDDRVPAGDPGFFMTAKANFPRRAVIIRRGIALRNSRMTIKTAHTRLPKMPCMGKAGRDTVDNIGGIIFGDLSIQCRAGAHYEKHCT